MNSQFWTSELPPLEPVEEKIEKSNTYDVESMEVENS
jgi:hypothetical protein